MAVGRRHTYIFKYLCLLKFLKMENRKHLLLLLILTFGLLSLCSVAQSIRPLPHPKNIILLIGDGMGFNHIKAADYYLGMTSQVYEQFPVRLAMAHYPAKAGEYKLNDPASNFFATGYNTVAAWSDTNYLKKNFTESAAAATALATGFKTYNNAIGISLTGDTLENLVEWAKALGKSAGVVTSVPFSHATPAGFVAHNKVRTNYSQIAYDMLLNSRCDVIMGCGDPGYDNNGNIRKGKWKDGKYVGDSAFWVQFQQGSGKQTRFMVGGVNKQVKDIDGDGKPDPWTVIREAEDFRALQHGATPKRIMGCPKVYSTLQEGREMNDFISTVPTLAEMAGGALNVLGKNPRGFFVMIEGGAIDWASHSNLKGRLMEEMTSFNEMVEAVVKWVNKNSNWDETLVIVTGDHETGLLWGGSPFIPLADRGKGKLPVMQFNSTEHTNSLIAFFAKGPGSELYRGFADECDSVRGPYIHNSEIPQLIHLMWNKSK